MLDIEWSAAEWPKRHEEGYGEIHLALGELASFKNDGKRPFIVLIDEARDGEEELEVLKGLFGSDDVVIATRAFNCYRFAPDDIPDRKLRKKYGKKTPAVFFFSADGKELSRVVGSKKKAKSVFSKMKKPFALHYTPKLSKWVKTYSEALVTIEKAEDDVANAKKAVTAIDDRITKKDKPSKKLLKKKDELVKKFEAMTKVFDKAMDKIAKLAEIPAKQDKKATAKN